MKLLLPLKIKKKKTNITRTHRTKSRALGADKCGLILALFQPPQPRLPLENLGSLGWTVRQEPLANDWGRAEARTSDALSQLSSWQGQRNGLYLGNRLTFCRQFEATISCLQQLWVWGPNAMWLMRNTGSLQDMAQCLQGQAPKQEKKRKKRFLELYNR